MTKCDVRSCYACIRDFTRQPEQFAVGLRKTTTPLGLVRAEIPRFLSDIRSVYVVNLARRADRWTHAREQVRRFLLRASCVQIDAVDGCLLSQVSQSGGAAPCLTSGAVACFLSHRAAWRRFHDSGQPYALILEDDAEFTANAALAFELSMRWVTEGTKAVLVGHIALQGPHCSSVPGTIDVEAFEGAHAYLLSRSGAEVLLEGSRGLPEQEVDHFIASCLQTQAPGSLLAFEKSLCNQRFFGYSDVHPDAGVQKVSDKRRTFSSEQPGSPVTSAKHPSESILRNCGIDVKARSEHRRSSKEDLEHATRMAAKWRELSNALKRLGVVEQGHSGGLCFGMVEMRGDPAIKRPFSEGALALRHQIQKLHGRPQAHNDVKFRVKK